MKDIYGTLQDLYEGKLKTVDELNREAQSKESEKVSQETDWERAKKLPAVQQVLTRMFDGVKEALVTLEASATDSSISDSQVRLLLVRYSTLKRAYLKAVNNEEQ